MSRRDHHGDQEHGLEWDVKLFFALTNAVSDAGCCGWDNKRAFNSVRPITAIRTLFRGQIVRAWAGPYQGTKLRGCHGPGAPPGNFEGIATTKGYKTYYAVEPPASGVDANRTLFHVR